jgi:hypothetical protein
MVRIILLVLLLGCATDNQINRPIDTKEAIKDLQSIEITTIKDSAIRERVVRVLQDCGEYGKEAYKSATTLQTRVVELEKQLLELEEEIKPYRYFKRFLLVTIIALLLFFGIKFYLKLKPI